MANVRPLHDQVLIKRIEETKTSPGGIALPDSAAEKPSEGEVLAIGNGKLTKTGELRPLEVKSGDRVLFGKYSGSEIKLDGNEYLMMRESDILAVLEK